MAIYKTISIPASETHYKVVPACISIGGNELDRGSGRVTVSPVYRLVDENGDPILDGEGKFQYRGADGEGIMDSVEDILGLEFAGITGGQVLEWIAAYFDAKLSSAPSADEPAEAPADEPAEVPAEEPAEESEGAE